MLKEAGHVRLADLEKAMDDEVYRLYKISDIDRVAIEAELRTESNPLVGGEQMGDKVNDEDAVEVSIERILIAESGHSDDTSSIEVAVRWISYTVGIVLGRFELGTANMPGRAV